MRHSWTLSEEGAVQLVLKISSWEELCTLHSHTTPTRDDLKQLQLTDEFVEEWPLLTPEKRGELLDELQATLSMLQQAHEVHTYLAPLVEEMTCRQLVNQGFRPGGERPATVPEETWAHWQRLPSIQEASRNG